MRKDPFYALVKTPGRDDCLEGSVSTRTYFIILQNEENESCYLQSLALYLS
jgi:hypothetical protein